MAQRKQNAFIKASNDYADAYSKKKYDQCLDLLARIDVKSNYKANRERVDYLLRSASHALGTLQNPKPQYTVTVAKAYESVFLEIAQEDGFETYFTILLRPLFDQFVKHLPKLPPSALDMSAWLRTMNTHLFQVLNNADIVDDDAQTQQKGMYLKLTQVLLIFVNAEEQRAVSSDGRRDFSESKRFIANCKQFQLYREGKAQYNICFDFLGKFLEVLSLEAGKGKQANGIREFSKDLKSLGKSKDVRATLVQDNYITVAKIIKACEALFIKAAQLEPKNVVNYFGLIGTVSYATTHVKSEKTFCTDCKEVGMHCCHEITMTAVEMYLVLVNGEVDNAIVEQFAQMIRTNFEAVSKIKCAKALNTQAEAIRKFQTLNQECKTREKVAFLIPVLCSVLKYYDRIKMMEETTKWFDRICLLNYLFFAYDTAENLDDMLNVGFFLLATLLASPKHRITFDTTAWHMIKGQKAKKSLYTPYDHFQNIKTVPTYGVEMPKQFNLNQLTLTYLSVGMKLNIMAPELSNKITHQLLMSASPTDSNALRFSLFTQSMKFDKVTSKRVDKLVEKLHAESKNDLSIALQLAAIKYLRFNFESTEFSTKHCAFSISEALQEQKLALDTSIFRTITFEFEKDQIDTLRYVKERFINFAYFYLEKVSAEDRKTFDDEKDLLLRELKVVANQFIVRDYLDDGMDMYMALFKLSKEVNDEFGLIDACSFFAEYRSHCKRRFPKEDLNAIISNCFDVAVVKLKELQKLSQRKQNQVCFCLLNLVLFYYEEGGDKHKQDIHLILSFIFKTIGGIGDKDMEESMDAVVGVRPVKDDQIMPKIRNEAVRIKFYSVLFNIITKYGAPTAFHPAKFVDFVLNHLKKFLSVYYDASVAIPILMFNMVPEMLMWLAGRYEFCVEDASLLLTLIKFSLRYGYALRAANNIITYLQIELLSEKLSACKTKLKALENIMLSEAPSTEQNLKLEDKVNLAVSPNQRLLCEPIRKQSSRTSPMKCLSPRQVNQRGRMEFVNKFLLKHQVDCLCAVCNNNHNRFQMFCAAVSYARYVYLNDKEFDVTAKRVIFNELFEYWENSRKEDNKTKKYPRTDLYYVVSARMLSYYAHFQWKYEKNYVFAKELFTRGLKGLERLEHSAQTMKDDFKHQIDMMTAMILAPTIQASREQLYGGLHFFGAFKKFDDEPSTACASVKKPQKQTKPANEMRGPTNLMSLLDLMDGKPQQSSGFQIHDDGAMTSTPIVKKTTRSRPKKTSPIKVGTLIATKSSEPVQPRRRVQRFLPPPSVQIDLTSPPETSK